MRRVETANTSPAMAATATTERRTAVRGRMGARVWGAGVALVQPLRGLRGVPGVERAVPCRRRAAPRLGQDLTPYQEPPRRRHSPAPRTAPAWAHEHCQLPVPTTEMTKGPV